MYNLELTPTETVQVALWADSRKKDLEEAGETRSAAYKAACAIAEKCGQAIKAGNK